MNLKHYLPTQLKAALARGICHPTVGSLVGVAFGDMVPSEGLRFDTSHPRVSTATKASLFWGLYESAEVRLITSLLRPDLDVIEVGGSIGVVSNHIRAKLSPKATLTVVEADAQLAEIARANLAINHPGARFDVMHRAISYDGPTARFQRRGANISGSLADADAADVVEVPAATLGDIVEESGVDRFTLVADIEGAEAAVIHHDADLLAAQCDQIIIELHETDFEGRHFSVEALRRALLDLGFVLDRRDGHVFAFRKPEELR